MRTNAVVITPLGIGTIQGRWSADSWLVRVPITDASRKRLSSSLTPRATCSGLWVLPAEQLKVVA